MDGRIPLVGALVLLVASGAAAAPADDAILYLHYQDLDAASVFLWYGLEPTAEDTTRAFGVPVDAQRLVVQDGNASTLHFLTTAPGIIEVGLPPGTTAVQIVAYEVALGAGHAVRLHHEAPERPLWVVVAAPDGYQPGLDAAWRSGTAAELADAGWIPHGWPVPADSAYTWTTTPLAVLPDAIPLERRAPAAPYAPYSLVVALLVLLLATTVWLFVRVHAGLSDPTRRKELPWMDHLEELRRRIIRIGLTVLIASIVFFVLGFRFVTIDLGAITGLLIPLPYPTIYDNAAAQVFTLLSRLVVPPGVQVVVVTPWDAVVTQLTIAAALGILVTFPILFYHTYAFLAPGLYPAERNAVLTTVPLSVLLFLGGAAFGILGMMPFLIDVLYGFAGTLAATALLNVHDLVGLAVLMGITFGLAFQLPVVMALTARLGLVRAATYRKYWRHATVAIFAVAMVITDPTVISQIIVGSVLMVLYGIGLVLAAVLEKRASRAPAPKPAAPEA